MQAFNTYYKNKTELEHFLEENSLGGKENLFVQVFTSIIDKEYIQDLIQTLKDLCQGIKILGTTTAGEINNGEFSENTTVLSFLKLEKSLAKTNIVECSSDRFFEVGRKLALEVLQKDSKVIIVFSHGNYQKGFTWDKLLDGIGSVDSKVILAGGVAGNNKGFDMNYGHTKKWGQTYVFTEDGITGEGAVAAALNGNSLYVSTNCNLGWKRIGKKMKITEVKQMNAFSRVISINNTPALEIYRKYFGDQVADNLPYSALEFSFIKEVDGLEVAAAPMEIHDDGSIIYGTKLEKGQEIQFGFGDSGLILNESLRIAKEVAEKPVQAIFSYSCATRRKQLSHITKHELIPFANIAPMSGFFTYGEFFHHKNQHYIIGQTMTILSLSETQEKNQEKPIITLGLDDTRSINTMLAIQTLVQRMTEELELEHKKAENLLLNVLPATVAEELKRQEKIIANEIKDATVLFADIVGFTSLSSKTSPVSLVGMLNQVFSGFDDLLEKYNLEKIKTIGDAYMLAGGVPNAQAEHSKMVAFAAIEMLQIIRKFDFDGTRLDIRIGIHRGPLIAGVLGTKKFAYDLWGDTVNTASRMESHGIPGKIHVSEEVYQILKDEFVFEKRGEIHVKGKGKMTTYFLNAPIG